jgi:hypothetical protein
MALMDGVNHLLCLEDDAVFRPNFAEGVKQFLEAVPPDFDGFMLGGQPINYGAGSKLIKPGVRRCLNVQRTHAFSVKGRYMRELYRHWTKPEAVYHCDWLMGGAKDRKIEGIQSRFNIYAPSPFLICQDQSKSDINGRVNPRKCFDPPDPKAPMIIFQGPRHVAEGMFSEGWHIGFDRDANTGIDKGLIDAFGQPDPTTRLRKWVHELQWEVASMENAILVMWHPSASEAIAKRVCNGPIYHVKADTIEEAREFTMMPDKPISVSERLLKRHKDRAAANVKKPTVEEQRAKLAELKSTLKKGGCGCGKAKK